MTPSSPDELITPQVERLAADFRLRPVLACELEFYLHGSEGTPGVESFPNDIILRCNQAGIIPFKYEKERGREQHEVALAQTRDPIRAATEAVQLKTVITDTASVHGMRADFSAKPIEEEPGSGLHVHVHLADKAGKNVFYKDDNRMSDPLKHSIGGLLAWLPDCMPVFAPQAESYARFAEKTQAPLTQSWGANNRTVAIRLPDAPHENKRIEHRVAGADADPAKVIAVILAAMHWGMKTKADPGAQVYGDAALPVYNLPRLPATLEEAQKKMRESKLLKDYFSASAL